MARQCADKSAIPAAIRAARLAAIEAADASGEPERVDINGRAFASQWSPDGQNPGFFSHSIAPPETTTSGHGAMGS